MALVVGVEKMSELSGPEIGATLLKASYLAEEEGIAVGFAGVFGQIAQITFNGTATSRTLWRRSPPRTTRTVSTIRCAQMRKDLGYEFCRQPSEKNPFVAGPLKRTDCSLVSDGAAALT